MKAANLVENGVVFPPVSCCQPVFMSDCVVLDFVSLLPSTSVAGPTARGVRNVLGVEEGGASIISRWPWDSGPEAISKQFD